jgi:hypothetical protein
LNEHELYFTFPEIALILAKVAAKTSSKGDLEKFFLTRLGFSEEVSEDYPTCDNWCDLEPPNPAEEVYSKWFGT